MDGEHGSLDCESADEQHEDPGRARRVGPRQREDRVRSPGRELDRAHQRGEPDDADEKREAAT